MQISKTRKGELFVLTGTTMWAFFPIVSSVLVNSISPIFSLSLSSFTAAIFFAILITLQKGWRFKVSKSGWKNTLLATLFIGIIFYSLMFFGLTLTGPGNLALISNMEIFFAMVILGSIAKHEKITKNVFVASMLMILGSLLIIFPGKITPNPGDILVLLAVLLVPIGNIFQQKARQEASSVFIMFWRSLISGIFTLFLATLLEPQFINFQLEPQIWLLIIINGFLLFGLSKVCWIEGIHRINISHANVIGSIYPGLTLIFTFLILGDPPTAWQIAGFIPMLIGLQILARQKTT